MNNDFCIDVNENLTLCGSTYTILKFAGLGITLLALSSSVSDLRFIGMIVILFLIGELMLNSVATKNKFEVPMVYNIDPRPRLQEVVAEIPIEAYGKPNISEPYVYELVQPKKRSGRLNTVSNANAYNALTAKVGNDGYYDMKGDGEGITFRDQHNKNRIHAAILESNTTSGGYKYAAPQENRTLERHGKHTYLDSMGIYQGGIYNGEFKRTEDPRMFYQ